MGYMLGAKWTKKWMAEAAKLLRDTWNEEYANLEVHCETNVPTTSNAEWSSGPNTASLNVYNHLPSLTTFESATPTDELTRYLHNDIENINIGDALQWWAGKERLYPRLSRMAMDYLSIPGKSPLLIVFIIVLTHQ
jgi:hypothetical protein